MKMPNSQNRNDPNKMPTVMKMPNSQNRKYPNKMPNSQPTLRKKRNKT